jgi:hypothetical protein
MFVVPITIPCDISECGVETAFNQIFKPEYSTLIVGTNCVKDARKIVKRFKNMSLWIEPTWKDEWMVRGPHMGVFSEAF